MATSLVGDLHPVPCAEHDLDAAAVAPERSDEVLLEDEECEKNRASRLTDRSGLNAADYAETDSSVPGLVRGEHVGM
jgi:hypothetical protein